jgi:hypothetical protein
MSKRGGTGLAATTTASGGDVGGCTGGYVNDPVGFCQDEPQDACCANAGLAGVSVSGQGETVRRSVMGQDEGGTDFSATSSRPSVERVDGGDKARDLGGERGVSHNACVAA